MLREESMKSRGKKIGFEEMSGEMWVSMCLRAGSARVLWK